MKPIQQIRDLLDLNSIQRIQDDFARSMNLAFITVDYRGVPITQPSGFTEFCSKAREKVAFREMCFQCDAHGGLHSAITGVPYIYRCHADLVDFAVPLILEGSYVGAVLGGQVKLRDKEIDQLEYLIPRQMDWQKDPELAAAHEKIKVTEYAKVESSVTLLRNMIQYLLEEAYRKSEEPAEAEKPKEQEEAKAGGSSLNAMDSDRVFYILNVAAKMAYQEKAPRTESVICDFADMLRYVWRSEGSKLTTIGEELDYVAQLLRVQKAQLGEHLSYQLDVPESCRAAVCPRMLLQPLVSNALHDGLSDPSGACSIQIRGETDKDDVLIYVCDNGAGMSSQTVESILDTQGFRDSQDERVNLYNMNRRLKGFFGARYGMTIRSVGDGVEGTEICVRIPAAGLELMDRREMR